jgi:uncharacterized membrane protein
MNSNQLRYVAMGVYLVVGSLVVFNVITQKQATELFVTAVAAKEFGQTFVTPATNARTPDNAPAKPTPPASSTPT